MRVRGEPFDSAQDREENVAAFSCGEYPARKCRNTILKEDGEGDIVLDWPQGAVFRELKAGYSPASIPETFSSPFSLLKPPFLQRSGW